MSNNLEKDYINYIRDFKDFDMSVISSRENCKKIADNQVAHPFYRYEFVAEMIEKQFNTKELDILDFGCANGALSLILSKRGYKPIDGIDQSKQARKDFKYLTGVTALPSVDNITKTYDIIVALETFEHLVNPEEYLQKLWSHLKQGGILIFTVPREKEKYSPDHRTFFDFYDVKDLCLSVNPVEYYQYHINSINKRADSLDTYGAVIYK